MIEKEIRRKKISEASRERRRKRRKRVVMVEMITVFFFIVAGLAGGIVFLWNMMPEIKIAKQLEAAGEYVQTEDYEGAIASCEEALRIDSKSIKAYRAMAGVYLTQEDWESAEQVLYRGWETTQDESLLQEYCVHLLNDAVADINAQNCTLQTLEKCVMALEEDQVNADGYKLLDACYGRLFMSEDTELFCNGEDSDLCAFNQYLEIMNRMLAIYQANPVEELKAEIIKFAVPANPVLWLDVRHITDYQNLLSQIAAMDEEGQSAQLAACLAKAAWAQDTFEEAFAIFDSGEFAPIKEFMQSEEYISIRDQFIDGTMEYWDGKTYIPVSREKMKLMQEDGHWTFSFADFDDCPHSAGVIKVWGAKQEDAGVQRLCISYEPAAENGEYYPHTTYEFVYLYSNVKIGGEYVPQMNYRFETRVSMPEGTTSYLIGDWGGEHEWVTEY
ncbi:MAG: tetratricopeptide repeat protein [Lachnospiraceae bacterium]|nr:tetratricopeptide repeat protein [Lachnospiraceae bacterium]